MATVVSRAIFPTPYPYRLATIKTVIASGTAYSVADKIKVTVPEFTRVKDAGVLNITGGYKAIITDITDNVITIAIYYYQYSATDDNRSIELPDGYTFPEDVTITLLVIGE